MNLEKSLQALYETMALDKTLRDEILGELVEDEGVCLLLSLHSCYTITNLKLKRGGHTEDITSQLSGVLADTAAYWGTLSLHHQIVLKDIFSNTSIFNYTIFYAKGKRVFSKKEILEHLPSSNVGVGQLKYILTPSPKYYYVTKNSRIKYSTIPPKFSKKSLPFIPNYTTVVFDNDANVIAKGNVYLGDYLRGTGRLGDITGYLSEAPDLPTIQYNINKQIKFKYALVFHPNGVITIVKEFFKKDYAILDVTVTEDFEVSGVWVVYKEIPYQIKCKVPTTVIERGIQEYTVTLEATELLNGKLRGIHFVKFNLKDSYGKDD